jgi:erythromycin esterase-like protein
MNRSACCLLLLSLAAGCAASRQRPAAPAPTPILRGGLDADSSAQLDELVKDVCSKSVVMLGEESHHGGGRTLEVKIEIVHRLIERCEFDAVYFESGGYEFFDLDRRLAAGESAPEQLADAIGGLWSVSNAVDPLVDYLYDRAAGGRIRLAGIDAQIGNATSGYEARALPHDLTQTLDEPARSTCAEVISRRPTGASSTNIRSTPQRFRTLHAVFSRRRMPPLSKRLSRCSRPRPTHS